MQVVIIRTPIPAMSGFARGPEAPEPTSNVSSEQSTEIFCIFACAGSQYVANADGDDTYTNYQ